MRLVVVESPYAGDVEANVEYARACVLDCLQRNESPLASHLLYTQPGILDDGRPEQRLMGIAAGQEWLKVANAMVVYTDRGISQGMRMSMNVAQRIGLPIEFRSLDALSL